jgi:hypothetical protein
LETTAKLLNSLEDIFGFSSKRALKSLNNQADFDSAIRRFDPSRPSQLKSLSNHPLFRAFILNAFLLLTLNVCRHFVRQPVCVPLRGGREHALLGALGVTNVALLRPMR